MASLPVQAAHRFGRAILAVLFPLAGYCSSDPGAESAIERDARALRDLTVPPAARSLDVAGVERINSTVRVSWVFETTWGWQQYARWATDRLKRQGRFTEGPEGRESLEFLKQLPGDTHVLRIELMKPGPPALVRVVFRAWAS